MSPYWDYYEKTSPKAVKNGLKAKSKRGSIGETWWSKRWVSVLESFDMGARLTRGKSYARKGQVISIDVEPGVVQARVQGSFAQPYDVSIKLVPLSPEEWEKAIAAMASKAVFSARLLSGEMPQTHRGSIFRLRHISLSQEGSGSENGLLLSGLVQPLQAHSCGLLSLS